MAIITLLRDILRMECYYSDSCVLIIDVRTTVIVYPDRQACYCCDCYNISVASSKSSFGYQHYTLYLLIR